jgi:hypothetical protein
MKRVNGKNSTESDGVIYWYEGKVLGAFLMEHQGSGAQGGLRLLLLRPRKVAWQGRGGHPGGGGGGRDGMGCGVDAPSKCEHNRQGSLITTHSRTTCGCWARCVI